MFADGGIRTGEDVLAALALGARAVFLGRPVLWALACGGADGVRSLLTGLTDDLAHAMALRARRSRTCRDRRAPARAVITVRGPPVTPRAAADPGPAAGRPPGSRAWRDRARA